MAAHNLIHAMLTDIGRSRSHNEDSAAIAPELNAFVVCDGMGGAAAGEVASQLAVSTFLNQLRLPSKPGRPPQNRLDAAILAANAVVHHQSLKSPGCDGMGTTLVALLYVPTPAASSLPPSDSAHPSNSTPPSGSIAPADVTPPANPAPPADPVPFSAASVHPQSANSHGNTPPDLFLANVGDSRCYRLRACILQQLSTDHSFVDEQLRAGQITPEQAATSPMRNYITRAIGPDTLPEPDIQGHRTQPGDLYLLCSDGLTRELDDDTLASILTSELSSGPIQQNDLDAACAALVDAANDHGGRDNITVLLLAIL